MFPRVNVNDVAEKGGPKAAPRNKMSLYEQLSIPSHRFIQAATTSVHPPTQLQGVANKRGAFFSPQSEKKYTHQCPDLNTPLMETEKRKKSEEDEFALPIFVHSAPSNFSRSLKSPQTINTGPPEITFEKEARSRMEESLEKNTSDRIKPIEKTEADAGSKSDSRRSTTATVSEENFAELKTRKGSNLARAFFLPEAQKVLHDTSNDVGFRAGRSGSRHTRCLERVGSLSEDSVVDSIAKVDLTSDVVVGIIGQKHFWKARRVIMNQQRIFAVQVFELHRLIKVQRLIAASPHLFRDDSAYINKPIKASLGKRKSLNFPHKETPCASKQRVELEKPILIKNKSSVENATEHKASCSSVQTGVPAPNIRPDNSWAPSMNSDYNSGTWGFNPPPPPPGKQWLILVMSPSEGLTPKLIHK